MSIMLREATRDEKKLAMELENLHHCGCCGHSEVRLVRLHFYEDRSGKILITPTMCYTWVCQNTECVMYIDVGKIKTWRRG